MTDVPTEDQPNAEDFQGRLVAVTDAVNQALHALEHAVNLAGNGIVWGVVDVSGVTAALALVQDQATALEATVTG